MDRDRVAGEGVYGENIKVLRLFALQTQTGVAHGDIEFGFAVRQEIELGSGNIEHQRVNFVVTNIVAQAAIGSDGSGAEPDHADPNGALLLFLADGDPDAGIGSIV